MSKLLTECLVVWWFVTWYLLWLDGNNLPKDQRYSILLLWSSSHLFYSWALLRLELKVKAVCFLREHDGAWMPQELWYSNSDIFLGITTLLLFVSGETHLLQKAFQFYRKSNPEDLSLSSEPQQNWQLFHILPSFYQTVPFQLSNSDLWLWRSCSPSPPKPGSRLTRTLRSPPPP